MAPYLRCCSLGRAAGVAAFAMCRRPLCRVLLFRPRLGVGCLSCSGLSTVRCFRHPRLGVRRLSGWIAMILSCGSRVTRSDWVGRLGSRAGSGCSGLLCPYPSNPGSRPPPFGPPRWYRFAFRRNSGLFLPFILCLAWVPSGLRPGPHPLRGAAAERLLPKSRVAQQTQSCSVPHLNVTASICGVWDIL